MKDHFLVIDNLQVDARVVDSFEKLADTNLESISWHKGSRYHQPIPSSGIQTAKVSRSRRQKWWLGSATWTLQAKFLQAKFLKPWTLVEEGCAQCLPPAKRAPTERPPIQRGGCAGVFRPRDARRVGWHACRICPTGGLSHEWDVWENSTSISWSGLYCRPGRGFGLAFDCTSRAVSLPASWGTDAQHWDWTVIDNCVSLFLPETGRSNDSILLDDCFFNSQEYDVVLRDTVCPSYFHRGGGQAAGRETTESLCILSTRRHSETWLHIFTL